MTAPAPLRADAQRNRQRIVDAAKLVFSGTGDFGPEAVARAAGVGTGTLYRHFPDRTDLAAAVYDDELRLVAGSAAGLLAESESPEFALRRFMDRFAERLEHKRQMAPALQALMASGAVSVTETRARLSTAVDEILQAGVARGQFRLDARGDDVVAALVGVCLVCSTPGSADQLGRLLDLVASGVSAAPRSA